MPSANSASPRLWSCWPSLRNASVFAPGSSGGRSKAQSRATTVPSVAGMTAELAVFTSNGTAMPRSKWNRAASAEGGPAARSGDGAESRLSASVKVQTSTYLPAGRASVADDEAPPGTSDTPPRKWR